MKEIIKKYWSELKNGTKTMFKEFFNKETNKKQRANMWTFSRLVTSFLIPICSLISILTANISLFLGSIAITGFGALTDFFDGRSARKHNSYSEFGKFLDQVSDKIFSIMVGINLSLFNPLFLTTLLGEVGIASINVYYKAKQPNLDIKSTQIGRIKQWPLFLSLILGFVSTLLPSLSIVTNISILLTALFQLATAASYIKSNNENIKILKTIDFEKNIDETENNNEKNNEKVKTKSIEGKNNVENDKTLSKLEEYTKLRNVLNEIMINKDINNNFIENSYQKTKK